MTIARVALVLGAPLLAISIASCDEGTPVSSRNISLGSGLNAALGPDGSFVVTQNGKRLLASAAKSPLFSRAIDTDNPANFHNPSTLTNDTFVPISPGSIEMDSPAPGVVHLSTTNFTDDNVLVSLMLAADDGFYGGLGERFTHADARGEVVGMQLEIDGNYESGTTDRHVPVPWFVSSNGYAVFVKSRESGAFDMAATDPSIVRATFEGTSMDVTMLFDPDPLQLVAKLSQLTGLPRATPASVLAPMLWRHVDSEQEFFSDLQMIRSLHIPTSTFWIDDGWQNSLNSMHFDTTKYPDLPSISSRAAALGFDLWGWSTPYLENPQNPPTDEAQALYPQAAAGHYFVRRNDGTVFGAPGPDAKIGFGMIDFTNPLARLFWATRVSDAVSAGFHGFKLDYGEDAVPDLLNSRLGLLYDDGETDRTARSYPLGYHGAYRDALAAAPNGGTLIVRASTYGGAAIADVIWPGDLDNGFQHRGDPGNGNVLVGGLPASVVAAQSLAASGFPLYGADIAGYRGDTPTKESLLRWAEASALSMVMQLGPGEKKYPWNYDSETVAIYTELAALHQKLIPYLAALLSGAQQNGAPTIESLPLAFPSDADAKAVADDEYMLGPFLLCAPVTFAGATSRVIHLPPGTWFSWWNGARFDGPISTTVPAPLGEPPLFVRSGAILAELPDGIDTLFASNDPSTVSAAAVAQFAEAAAWVSGNASARTLDGGLIVVMDDAAGVTINWTPSSSGRFLTMSLDLSARTGSSGALGKVTLESGSFTAVNSEAEVRSASSNAYFLAGNKLVVRVDGANAVLVR
jgi:alpha-glucosidase (family GH31 glycosyl hydrolase)